MIKNIVLDMGNVLIRFDPELFLSRYVLTEEQRKMLLEQVFRSVEWVMLDRAHWTKPEQSSASCPACRSRCMRWRRI